jgi:hypothetical protein
MHSQYRLRRGNVAHHQGGVLVGVYDAAVGDQASLTPAGGYHGLGHSAHQPLPSDAVGDKLVDAEDLQTVAGSEPLEVGQASHGAVGLHDLA